MNKRGLSHIEIILGFVLFASAVFFIFYFFDVGKVNKDNESIGIYVFNQIKKNISTEVISYSVKINPSALSSDKKVAIELNEEIPNDFKLRAENYTGEKLPAKRDSIDRKKVYVDLKENLDYVRILFCRDMDYQEGNFQNPTLIPGAYEIISQEDYSVISQKKAEELKGLYDAQYSSLKKSFAVPNKINFGFELIFSDTEFIKAENAIPLRAEVYSKITRSEVIKLNGERVFADYGVKVW